MKQHWDSLRVFRWWRNTLHVLAHQSPPDDETDSLHRWGTLTVSARPSSPFLFFKAWAYPCSALNRIWKMRRSQTETEHKPKADTIGAMAIGAAGAAVSPLVICDVPGNLFSRASWSLGHYCRQQISSREENMSADGARPTTDEETESPSLSGCSFH